MNLPFIDIHSHQPIDAANIITVVNRIIPQDTVDNQPCTAGIHPWYINKDMQSQLDDLSKHAQASNVLAIGECGMDKIHQDTWPLQSEIFANQIQLANRIQKPLIIHCVRAYQETLHILKDQKVAVPVIFHGFNKKLELAQSLFQQGYYISLGTSILNGKQDDLIQTLDLTNFFFETDNKSTSIVDIYSYFCTVRGIKLEVLQEQIVQNILNVFKYNIIE